MANVHTHTHTHTPQEAGAIAVPISQSWKVRCRGVHHLRKVTNNSLVKNQGNLEADLVSILLPATPTPLHSRDSLYLKGDAWEPIYPKCFHLLQESLLSFKPSPKKLGKTTASCKIKKEKKRKIVTLERAVLPARTHSLVVKGPCWRPPRRRDKLTSWAAGKRSEP